MARPRFPGRPGCRYERISVRYGEEEFRTQIDPNLGLVRSFYCGLKLFRELVGESDEDDDFEGFTLQDVRASNKKYTAMLSDFRNEQDGPETPKNRTSSIPLAGSHVRQIASKTRRQRLCKNMASAVPCVTKEGLNSKINNKSCFHSSRTVQSINTATEKVATTAKLKNIKIRLEPDGKQAKIVRGRGRPSLYVHTVKEKKLAKLPSVNNSKDTCDSSAKQNASAVGSNPVASSHKLSVIPHSKSKRLGKQLAKQLLLKARKGHETFSKDGVVDVTAAAGYHRKRFILPTKSSRSSRVIKPNKRFLEDDGYQIMFSKSHKIDSYPATSWFADTGGPTTEEPPLLPLQVDPLKCKDAALGKDSSSESCPKFAPPPAPDPSKVPHPVGRRKKHGQLTSGLHAETSVRKAWRTKSRNLVVSTSNKETKTAAKTISSSNLSLGKDKTNPKGFLPFHYAGSDKTAILKSSESLHSGLTKKTRRRGGGSRMDSVPLVPTSYSQLGLHADSTEVKSNRKSGMLHSPLTESPLTGSALSEHKMGVGTSVRMPGMLGSGVDLRGLNAPGEKGYASTESGKIGLFDMPLIVEGKRQRKPSLRMRLKQSEEIFGFRESKRLDSRKIILDGDDEDIKKNLDGDSFSQDDQEERNSSFGSEAGEIETKPSLPPIDQSLPTLSVSPFCPKLELFSSTGCGVSFLSPTEKQKMSEPVEKETDAARQGGNNILRKAKFQLNWAALNRSKAALARSLRAKMRQDARLEKKKLREQEQKLKETSVTSPLTLSSLSVLSRGLIDVHGSPKQTQIKMEVGSSNSTTPVLSPGGNMVPFEATPLSSVSQNEDDDDDGSLTKEAALKRSRKMCAVCGDKIGVSPFLGVPCCTGCRKFYTLTMKRKKNMHCKKSGSCSINRLNKSHCSACRMRRCREIFPCGVDLSREKQLPPDTEQMFSPAKRPSPYINKAESLSSPAAVSSEEAHFVQSPMLPPKNKPNHRRSRRTKAEMLALQESLVKEEMTTPGEDIIPTTLATPFNSSHPCGGGDVGSGRSSVGGDGVLSSTPLDTTATSPYQTPPGLSPGSTPGSGNSISIKGPSAAAGNKSGGVLKMRRRRKVRCKQCEGCVADDCGTCVYCLDKPKYGGKNVIKQACINRRCKFPRYTKFATPYIAPKKESSEDKTESPETPCNIINNNNNSSNSSLSISQPRCHRRGAASVGSSSSGGGGQLDSGTSPGYQPRLGKPNVKLKRQFLFQQLKKRTKEKAVTLYGKSTDSVNMYVQAPPIYSGADGYFSSKNLEHIAIRKWTSQDYMYSPTAYRIKVDYKEDCDLCRVWEQGLAILVSTPLCVRTMCYLCGSAGQHEFVYCQLCCEPFHMFCLEEDWRPTDKNIDNWCCYRCHYCQVCGQQNNLLQCNKCHETYHPECLGPNYPTKPSKKKKIWICTKCVRCKSCGATTPGNSGNATWMHDFSLCYECGKLMDKGNYCPICRKCYTDDDWDSKMVQCSSCDSWVHSKCAGLTDELYLMFSHLPEDVQYICALCSEKSPAQWECVIQETMQHGFQRVMHVLQNSKCAQHLLGPMAAKLRMERFKKKSKPKNCKVNTCSGDDDLDSSQDDSTSNSSLSSPSCKSEPSPCQNAPIFKVPLPSPRSKISVAAAAAAAAHNKTLIGGGPAGPCLLTSTLVSGCDKLIKSEAVTTSSSSSSSNNNNNSSKVATPMLLSSPICDSSQQTHSSDDKAATTTTTTTISTICSYNNTSRKCLLETFNKNSQIVVTVTTTTSSLLPPPSSVSPANINPLQTKNSELKASIDAPVPKTTAVTIPKTGGACRFVMGPMSPAGFFRRNISNRSHGISITSSTSKAPPVPTNNPSYITTPLPMANTLITTTTAAAAAISTTQSPPSSNNLNPSNSNNNNSILLQTSEASSNMLASKVISHGSPSKTPSLGTVCSSSSVNTVSALNGTIMTPNIVSCFNDTKAQSTHGSLVSSVTTCSFGNVSATIPMGNVAGGAKPTGLPESSLSQTSVLSGIFPKTTASPSMSPPVFGASSVVGTLSVTSSLSLRGSGFAPVTAASCMAVTRSVLAPSKFTNSVLSNINKNNNNSNNNSITVTTASITSCISSVMKSIKSSLKSSPSTVTAVSNPLSAFSSPPAACSPNTQPKVKSSKKAKKYCMASQKDKAALDTSKLKTIVEEEEVDKNKNSCLSAPVSTSTPTTNPPSINSTSTSQGSSKLTKCSSPAPMEDSTTDSASEESDDASPCSFKDVAICLHKERQKLFCEARKSKSLYTSDDGNLKCIPQLALKAEKVKDYPKNFYDIIVKINKVYYQSVQQFNEDMVRIIQTAINDQADQTVSRKRANNSVRSIFIKQMEKYFPWFNVKVCTLWDHNKNLPVDMLPDAVLPPSGDHTYAQWMTRPFQPYSTHDFPLRKTCTTPHKKTAVSHGNKDNTNETEEGSTAVEVCDDFRTCVLCWKTSDLDPEEEGRLVYVGQDDWIHVNCALWSAEAFEEESDGTLQNVQPAISRGKMMRCDKCTRPGATVGCCHRGCPANFHFLCAKQECCVFQEDKKVFCYNHRHKVDGDLVEDNDFDVIRRVCIFMDHQKYPKKSWVKGLPASGINVIIGSCTVECLGNLTPLSDRYDMLLPVGFRSTRVYWSTKHANKRCVYTCRISLVKPQCSKKLNKEQQRLQSAEHNTTKIEDPELLEMSRTKQLKEGAEHCGHTTGGGGDGGDDSVIVTKASAELSQKNLVPESNKQPNVSSDKPAATDGSAKDSSTECSTVDPELAAVENLDGNIIFTSEENKLLFGDGAEDMETVVVVAEAENMTDEEAIELAREALLAADSSNLVEGDVTTESDRVDNGEVVVVEEEDSNKTTAKTDVEVEQQTEIVDYCSQHPIVIRSSADEELPDNINSSLDSITEVQVRSECDKETMYSEQNSKPVQVISFNRKTLPLHKKPQNKYSRVGPRFPDDNKSTRFSPIYGPKGDIIGHKLSIIDALALKNSLPSNTHNSLKDHNKRRLKRFCSKKNVKLLELDKSGGGIVKPRKMVSSELPNSLHADKPRISEKYTGVTNKFDSGNPAKLTCNKQVQDLASGSEPTWVNENFDLGKNSAKPKNSPPVKIYPLRQTVSRMCEQALAKRPLEAISRSCRDDRAKSSLSVMSTVETPPEEEQVVVKRSEDIPLHDKIALKIRAESLAKSSPGERGPFKCPTCKRLYRTKESFETHVEKCDFELSTSEEEEEDQDGLRSPRRYLGNPRYPMRNSTLIQRVAAEVEAEMNFGKKIHSRKRSHDSMSGLDSENLDSAASKTKLSRGQKPEDSTSGTAEVPDYEDISGKDQAKLVENTDQKNRLGSSSEDFESKDSASCKNNSSTSQTSLAIQQDRTVTATTKDSCLPGSFADDSDATLSPAHGDPSADRASSLNKESCDKQQNTSASSDSADGGGSSGAQSKTDRNNLDLLSELASKLSKPPNKGDAGPVETESDNTNTATYREPQLCSESSAGKKLKLQEQQQQQMVEDDSTRLRQEKVESINNNNNKRMISDSSLLKQSVSLDGDSIPSEILPSSNSSDTVQQYRGSSNSTIVTAGAADDKTNCSVGGELATEKQDQSLFYQVCPDPTTSSSSSLTDPATPQTLMNIVDPQATKPTPLSKVVPSDQNHTDDINKPTQELLIKNKPLFNNSVPNSPVEFSANTVNNTNSFSNVSHLNNPTIPLVNPSAPSLACSLASSVNSSSHISNVNSSSSQLIQCQDTMTQRVLTATPVVTMALCNTVCNVQPQTTCVVAPAQTVQPLTMSMQSASPHLLSLTSVNTPYFNTSPALPTPLASPVFSQATVTPIAIASPLPSQPPATPTLSINYVGSFVLPSATDQLVNITPPLSSNPFSSIATSVPQLQSTANINTPEPTPITKIQQSATTMHHAAPNTVVLQDGSLQNKPPPYIIHKTSVPTMQNSSSVVKILVDNNPPTSFVTAGSSLGTTSPAQSYNYSKLLQEIFKVSQPPTITNQTSLITSSVGAMTPGKPDGCQATTSTSLSSSLVENPIGNPSVSSLTSSLACNSHKRPPNRKFCSRMSRLKPPGLKNTFVLKQQNCGNNQLAADTAKLVSGVEQGSKFIQNMVGLHSNPQIVNNSNNINRNSCSSSSINRSGLPLSDKEQFGVAPRKQAPSAVGLQSTKRILSFISNKNGIVSSSTAMDQQYKEGDRNEPMVVYDSVNNKNKTEDKAVEDAGTESWTPAPELLPNQSSGATHSKVFDPFTPKVSLRKKPVRKARNLNFRRRPRDLRKRTYHGGSHLNGDTPLAEMEEEVLETPFMSSQSRIPVGPSTEPKPDLNVPHLVFEISSDDGFYCRAHSIDDAWRQVYEAVQDVRALSKRKQLSYANIDGALMFGVSHRAVVYLLEQLHGAKKCYNYKFNYHSPPREYDVDDKEPTETSSGCIRTEPFSSRKPYDMFSFLMSRYRNRPQSNHATGDEEMALKSSRRPTSMDLPMAMRFRHLQAHAREAVGVYRSMIHGRGLFCKRNIDAGEMVIEYAGEVIRAELTDKREKFYESKGIGCYMFRIDDVEVVDATMHGNAARFINHSCDPNCYSKVIQVDGKKHIVIFAMRPIKRGEELTYDYKFPIEDIKITCTCGSRRCRKYLN
ncbi:histone-lysine N-methyltransferase 2A-like isoform X2 [Argonauta hians]